MLSPLKIAVSYRDFIYYILQNETTNNQKTRSHALTVGHKWGRKSTFEAVRCYILHGGDVRTKRGHFLYSGAVVYCLIQNNRRGAHPVRHRQKYDEMAREFYQKNYNREERRAYCRDLVEQMLTEYENATK